MLSHDKVLRLDKREWLKICIMRCGVDIDRNCVIQEPDGLGRKQRIEGNPGLRGSVAGVRGVKK